MTGEATAAAVLLDRVRHPRIHALCRYWLERRGAREFPARSDLDPLDMKALLGNIVLADVHRAPLRFMYRLHGSLLVQRDGYDMTGKWLSEHPEPEYRERIRASWTRMVEAREPVLSLRDIVVDGRTRCYEAVILPLASDGATIDKLISAQFYFD